MSGRGFLSKKRHSPRPKLPVWPTKTRRARRRLRQVELRSIEDDSFKDSLGKEITRLFPGCSQERAAAIAAHSGTRRSGRVGRSAAGRALDSEAVTLAVVVSVRHEDTEYDQLLTVPGPASTLAIGCDLTSKMSLMHGAHPRGAADRHHDATPD